MASCGKIPYLRKNINTKMDPSNGIFVKLAANFVEMTKNASMLVAVFHSVPLVLDLLPNL